MATHHKDRLCARSLGVWAGNLRKSYHAVLGAKNHKRQRKRTVTKVIARSSSNPLQSRPSNGIHNRIGRLYPSIRSAAVLAR